MSNIWKNKMIKHGSNYTDSTIKEMTDLLEIRVGNLEPIKKKKSSSVSKKNKDRKFTNIGKRK